MMYDAHTCMMHETNALRCSKSKNFENWSRKSSFMKNPQFMKNINPTFSKKQKLIITTCLKHVINIQSINYKDQCYPILSNWTKSPIYSRTHEPQFWKFSRIMKILKFKHRNHVYIMHRQKPIDHFKSKHPKTSKIPNFLSPKILRNLNDSCMLCCNLVNK